MKKVSVVALLLSFVMISFTTCKKDTKITCNLEKADKAPSEMTIVFKAVKTGDGTISTLTYQVGSTVKTISDPVLPWTVSVDALADDNISIKATGTTEDGSLTISYDGENATDKIEGEDSCSHSND